MSITVEPAVRSDRQHVVLTGVSWEAYEKLVDALAEQHVKLLYNEGTLEIMSPRNDHEYANKLLGRMIEAAAEELDADIRSLGSSTYKLEERLKGLEPDESYYLKSEPKVRGKRLLDLRRDPPPDLVVEVDITSYSVDKLDVYAGLGIPEIWNYDNGKMQFLVLRRAKYEPKARSLSFPFITVAEVQRAVARLDSDREKEIVRDWRAWIRKQSAKRN